MSHGYRQFPEFFGRCNGYTIHNLPFLFWSLWSGQGNCLCRPGANVSILALRDSERLRELTFFWAVFWVDRPFSVPPSSHPFLYLASSPPLPHPSCPLWLPNALATPSFSHSFSPHWWPYFPPHWSHSQKKVVASKNAPSWASLRPL